MDDAIKAFERAVQNGDSEGLATLQLSELYIETGRVMDGIQMLECNVENVMQVTRRKFCSHSWNALLTPACRTRKHLPLRTCSACSALPHCSRPPPFAQSFSLLLLHTPSLPRLLLNWCNAQVRQRWHVAQSAAAV
jgi:hypothetical protein